MTRRSRRSTKRAARRRTTPALASYLIDSQHRSQEIRRRRRGGQGGARAENPDDLRLMRLHAQALSRNGQSRSGDRASSNRRFSARRRPVRATSRWRRPIRMPTADAQAVKLLQDAQAKFPPGQLDCLRARIGVRQAEEVRGRRSGVSAGARRASRKTRPRSTISGTCSAERGERLDESVGYLKKRCRWSPRTARSSTASAGRITSQRSSISPRTTCGRPRIS